jgi:hypothetical protein
METITAFWAYTVVLDCGPLQPTFFYDIALEAAREAQFSGRRVIRIDRGPKTVLDGYEFERALSNSN